MGQTLVAPSTPGTHRGRRHDHWSDPLGDGRSASSRWGPTGARVRGRRGSSNSRIDPFGGLRADFLGGSSWIAGVSCQLRSIERFSRNRRKRGGPRLTPNGRRKNSVFHPISATIMVPTLQTGVWERSLRVRLPQELAENRGISRKGGLTGAWVSVGCLVSPLRNALAMRPRSRFSLTSK